MKINIFTAVKYCCILHGRVCVMWLIVVQIIEMNIRFALLMKNVRILLKTRIASVINMYFCIGGITMKLINT